MSGDASGDLATVATALGLYAAIVVSPGPSFAIVARMAAAGERRAAFGATLGLALAALAYAALALTGLAALLEELPGLARAVAVAGGLTLAWIGAGVWRGASAPLPMGGTDASRFTTGLLRGALVCLTNPKAMAFFTGIFAAAVPLGTQPGAKAAILGGVLVLEIGWYGAVALALARPGPRAAYARLRRPAERALGAGLVAIGLFVALGG